MARLSKKQAVIVNAHIQAWQDNIWDMVESTHAGDLKKALNEGKTHRGLWDGIVENKVSITGQLMMNKNIHNHLSMGAKRSIKQGFISMFKLLNIE